jgi:hypothetical protein
MSLYYCVISTLDYDESHITHLSHSTIIHYNRIVLSPIRQSPVGTSDKVLALLVGVLIPVLLSLRAKHGNFIAPHQNCSVATFLTMTFVSRFLSPADFCIMTDSFLNQHSLI